MNPALVPNKLIDLRHSPSFSLHEPQQNQQQHDQYLPTRNTTPTPVNHYQISSNSFVAHQAMSMTMPHHHHRSRLLDSSSNYDTSSLRSLRDVSSLSSSILNHKDSLVSSNSANNDSLSNISTSTLNDPQSKVMENYLILDRLNQKQQRKQQIKLKQQQQLDELRQRQHDLESKVHLQQQLQQQAGDEQQPNNFINSKLTAHYNDTTVSSPVTTNVTAASAADQTKFKLKVHHPSQLQQFQLNQKLLNSQNQFIQKAHDLKSTATTTTSTPNGDKSLNTNLKSLSSSKKNKSVSKRNKLQFATCFCFVTPFFVF